MHEAAHRIVFGRIVRNAGAAERLDDGLLGADPDRQHRFGRAPAAWSIAANQRGHRRRDLGGRRDRGLHVHHEDRVVGGIGQQDLERRRVTRGVGVADDVDRIRSGPCARQDGIELRFRIRTDRGRIPPSSTSRSIASTPMPPPLVRIASAFPGGNSTRPRVSAQSNNSRRSETRRIPARTERCLVDRVGTGQRAGVGRGSLRALRHAPRLDDDDRLDPRRGPRRRHELPGVLDRFDIEQDGAASWYPARSNPADRRYRRRAGRRSKRFRKNRHRAGRPNPPCRQRLRRIARSAPDSARGMCAAKLALRLAPGIMMPRQFGPISRMPYFLRSTFGGVRQRARAMPESRSDDERACGAARAGFVDETRNGRRRRRQQHEFGNKGQFVYPTDRGKPVNFGITGNSPSDVTLEAGLSNISQNRASDRTLARTCADQSDGRGRQQVFQAISRHRCCSRARAARIDGGITRG